MVLTLNNKVDIVERSKVSSGINRLNRLGSQSSEKTLTSESSIDKVRLNDDLLDMIITNNFTNKTKSPIFDEKNDNDNNKKNIYDDINFNIKNDDITSSIKLKQQIHEKLHQRMKIPDRNEFSNDFIKKSNISSMTPNRSVMNVSDLISNNDPKKKLNDGNNVHKEMPTMLDSNRVRSISTYFNNSSIVSRAIKDWFDGNVSGKLGNEQLTYDNIILCMAYLFCARNFMLAFIEDIELRGWLGEGERVRPYRQLVMVMTIWSVYLVAVLRNFSLRKNQLTWLEPFKVLSGDATPKSFGLSEPMLNSWYDYSISLWRYYFSFTIIFSTIVALQGMGMARHRWNTYPDPQSNNWYNAMLLFWTIMQIIWGFVMCMHTYFCVVFFKSLCYYFRIRYEKVNEDIEIIINKRMKANERVALLHHILNEHNSLCLKVSEYNKFWSSHLMSTYFFLVAVICFSCFQAFFTANLVIVRLYMFGVALIASYIITQISVSAAVMSNRAHHPYGRLIRVTFEKYPVELQIQLRMFIQRTSGPTIGFYCLDVFEITYTTYASILAALGQNFLLIVDFVRSYAEVGKEYEEISFSDLNMLTGSVFNSTLDVLDEMAGTHLSEALYSNTSLMYF